MERQEVMRRDRGDLPAGGRVGDARRGLLVHDAGAQRRRTTLYIPELDRLVLRDKMVERIFGNASSARKTAIRRACCRSRSSLCCSTSARATKRDLFYTDVKLFKQQTESDDVLDDAACMVGAREVAQRRRLGEGHRGGAADLRRRRRHDRPHQDGRGRQGDPAERRPRDQRARRRRVHPADREGRPLHAHSPRIASTTRADLRDHLGHRGSPMWRRASSSTRCARRSRSRSSASSTPTRTASRSSRCT